MDLINPPMLKSAAEAFQEHQACDTNGIEAVQLLVLWRAQRGKNDSPPLSRAGVYKLKLPGGRFKRNTEYNLIRSKQLTGLEQSTNDQLRHM